MRKTIMVEEKKETLKNMKAVMGEKTTLETVNDTLKTALTVAGIITAIDIILPDPIPGIDEAILAGITTLLGTVSVMVNKKVEADKKGEKSEIDKEDLNKLSESINSIINASKAHKSR